MTKLLQCLRDELVRRDYAATTIRSYIQIVDAFRQQTGARLDRITPAQLRRYHLFLLEERRLAIGTVVTQICALRFFCRFVLHRRDVREDLPYPKERLRLPVVLSPDEVQRLIAHAKNLYHRTLLLTLYGEHNPVAICSVSTTRPGSVVLTCLQCFDRERRSSES